MMLRYFTSKISKNTCLRVSLVLLILFIQIKLKPLDLKQTYPADNLIILPNENIGSSVHLPIEPTKPANMVGFERNKPTESEIIFPKGDIRKKFEDVHLYF